ncbi:MAG: hypothetical protein ABII18_07280 [bacterium]|nr:hypothetical protein [bacterium]MBU1918238.1 hypothetical protein [bacterium]
MLELNKKSMLVTVNPEKTLSTFKQHIANEGLYFGYYPLDDENQPILYYIQKRVPNLYHYKYGSLDQLISAITVHINDRITYHLKERPRAAIGPNFNALVTGTNNIFSEIDSLTLRLTSLPEKVLQGIMMVPHKDIAKSFLQYLIGHFMEPLFFRFIPLKDATDIQESIRGVKEPSDLLLFGLTGITEIINTEQELIEKWCYKNNIVCHWCLKKTEQDIVHKHIYVPDAYKDIRDTYRNFFWNASDASQSTEQEKELIQHLTKLKERP